MPRAASSRLSQPIFHEPFFNEDKPTPDPTGFETQHQSDTKTYKEVEDLLKKNVVPILSSRMADDDVFGLADAYGNHGPEIVAKIKKARKIIFHCCGDLGASNARKYANELRVADQVSIDCAQADANNRPAFLYHLGDVVYSFGEAQYYYDQFYEPSRGNFGHSRQSRFFHRSGHSKSPGAANNVPAKFLRHRPHDHAGGRLSASHRHDGAGRLLHA